MNEQQQQIFFFHVSKESHTNGMSFENDVYDEL